MGAQPPRQASPLAAGSSVGAQNPPPGTHGSAQHSPKPPNFPGAGLRARCQGFTSSWWCPAAEMMVSADSGTWGAPPGNKLCLPAHPGPSCITATNAGSWDSRGVRRKD